MAAGNKKTEALRLPRRRLSDEVFRRLRADEAEAKTCVPEEVFRQVADSSRPAPNYEFPRRRLL